MSFSENLMRLRKQKGLSQEELANEIDVSRQTVSKWELGSTTPEMDKLVQMSNFFGVSVDDLVNGDDVTSKVNNTNVKENVENKYETQNTEETKSKKERAKNRFYAIGIVSVISIILAILIILLVRELTREKNETNTTMIENVAQSNFNNNVENTAEKNTKNEVKNNVISSAENKIEERSENKTKNEVNNVIDGNTVNKVDNTVNQADNTVKKDDKNKQENNEKVDKNMFNMGFYNGTYLGGLIWNMLDRAVTSNKTNTEKIIVVKYNGIETSVPEEITQLKKKLEQFTQYEVILDYDNEGYINCITIE